MVFSGFLVVFSVFLVCMCVCVCVFSSVCFVVFSGFDM